MPASKKPTKKTAKKSAKKVTPENPVDEFRMVPTGTVSVIIECDVTGFGPSPINFTATGDKELANKLLAVIVTHNEHRLTVYGQTELETGVVCGLINQAKGL